MTEQPNDSIKNRTLPLIYGILFLILLALLYFSKSIILTALIGIGVGVLIAPLLGWVQRKWNFPRALSAFLVLTLIGLLVSGVLFSIYYIVSDQAQQLTERLPEIRQKVMTEFNQLEERFPWLRKELKEREMGQQVASSASVLFAGISSGFVAIGSFSIVIVIGLFTAIRSKEYFQGFVNMFPARLRPKTAEVMLKCATVFRSWFRAQLMDMAIIGTLTGLGLWIAGVQYWAVFGLLTALLGIIPFVGIFFVVISAVLVTLTSDPSQVPWVILIFFITQQIEAHLVIPLMMRGQIKLPEVPLIITMLLFGSWLGIIGILIAPPIFAVLKTIYEMTYKPRLDRQI